MLLDSEIAEERSVEHLDLKVLAPSGDYIAVTHVCKTTPMFVWRLETRSHFLECAGNHLVVTDSGLLPVDQLQEGQLLTTESGPEPVTKVEALSEERELYDLRVESEDHLYFTGGIASHNSTGLGGAELFKFNILPNYRSIYLTPLKEHSKTMADKLMDMQRGSLFPPDYATSKGLRNNMYYKESPNGGSLKLLHILTDPTKIRGNSVPAVVVDECIVTGSLLGTYDIHGKIVEKKIEDFEGGDYIVAHDRQKKFAKDRVRRVVCKGLRPVWRINLADGRHLVCTSNEKIQTTEGWVYLSQLLPPEDVKKCDRALQITSAIRRAAGIHTRGVTGGHVDANAGVHPPETLPDAWSSPGALLQSQSRASVPIRVNSSQVEREPWLREVELRFFNIHKSSIRLLTRPLLREKPEQRALPQGSEVLMGQPVDLEKSSLLVHGRWDVASEVSPLHDPQLHSDGMPPTSREASEDGTQDCNRQTNQEKQQDLLARGDPDGGLQDLSSKDPRVCPPVDDLQVGTGCEPPHVQLLSGGVRDDGSNKSHVDDSSSVLRESDVPAADGAGPGERSRQGPEKAPASNQRAGAGEARCDAQGGSAGAGQGEQGQDGPRTLQRHQEALEGQSQGAREDRQEAAEAHVPVLSAGVREHGGAQAGQAKSRNLLLRSDMLYEGDRGIQGDAQSQSSGEGQSEEGYGDLAPVAIESITYAGVQEVWDVETEKHHTLFAGGIAVHNCQDFDPEHLPEIKQVQKAFPDSRSTIFAGTSKDLDTCLESQFRLGSGGVWHIPCRCPKRWHALDDAEIIPAMMSVDGLRCPDDSRFPLDPMRGEFVHANPSRLNLNMPSFHLPQVIVPEYAQGAGFSDIWKDFKEYPFKKFLQEVWGVAVDAGHTELTERDLMACCTDKTFAQTQKDYLSNKVRYVKVFSGVDWGGSDHEPAYRSKLSYTVHSIWGMRIDGSLDLLYAYRYAGMHYREIAGTIVEQHNKYKAFAMGTDNGGGQYYNAYMRDCGRIPTNLIIHFQYTDTKLILDRIPHPEANIMSLHRTDSISALIADIKDQKVSWPRWDDSHGFVSDCLNVRRNITETPAGRTILRYMKPGSKADDFLMSMNYAAMMKRIINQEPLIPNKQLVTELRGMFGVAIPNDIASRLGGHIEDGYVSG